MTTGRTEGQKHREFCNRQIEHWTKEMLYILPFYNRAKMYPGNSSTELYRRIYSDANRLRHRYITSL